LRGIAGMTPARFDLVQSMARLAPLRVGTSCRQRAFRQALGVTGATISRMVKSLIELGMLVQSMCPEDRRQKMVTLTAKGLAWFRKAAAQARGKIEFCTNWGLGEFTNEALGKAREAPGGSPEAGIRRELLIEYLVACRRRLGGCALAIYSFKAMESASLEESALASWH